VCVCVYVHAIMFVNVRVRVCIECEIKYPEFQMNILGRCSRPHPPGEHTHM
jgi:hypothetical protein